jgi:hypothetical protein
MKPTPSPTRRLTAGCLGLGLLGLAVAAQARPYASSLTNDAGVISFRLNAPADNVKVIWNGGATTNNLGTLPKGLTTTANLGVTGPFKIEVAHASGPGYLQSVVNQISDDANNFVKSANQRGLAINKNPASPYFGRIYVSVSAPGTAGGRAVSDGIYLLNADQTDAVGQGNTPRTGGVNGGLGFDRLGVSTSSPTRVHVGADDNLYISDWSDANGGLYVTDPDVATNANAGLVLNFLGGPTTTTNNHGSISSVWVEGSLAGGNLTVYSQDEDLGSRNGVYRYDIGSGPLPYSGEGTLVFGFGLGAQFTKIVRGPDGKWYGSNRRAEFATSSGVFAMSDTGAPLWDSLSAWRTFLGDPTFSRDSYFGETYGLDVSPDGKHLAVFRGATNNPVAASYIPPAVAANTVLLLPLEAGVPNITNLIVMPTPGGVSIGREIAFDAVGNIYTVSSGQGVLRIYAPGGYAAVTTGSDGLLEVFNPVVDVSVTASEATISELNGPNVMFTFTRPTLGSSQPLPVRFQVSGNATRGADYVLKTNGVLTAENVVVIPGGATTGTVTLEPLNDSVAEPTEIATLSVQATTGYNAGFPGTATVAIADDEQPVLTISGVFTNMYEGNPYDYVRIRLDRLGDTNTFLFVSPSDFSYSGAAQPDVDFQAAFGSAFLNAGDTSVTYDLATPLPDALTEGLETFTVTLNSGFGYTAATDTVTCSITDAAVAPGGLLTFSADFNDPADTNAWSLKFAARNGIEDYSLASGYDYSASLIPPAPGGTDTLGLFMTVNKTDGTALGGAGMNLYPLAQSFSGNFVVRFDMYLIQNTGCAGTTEYAMFGINASGNLTNWFRYNGDGSPGYDVDGLFFQVEADAGNLGDYVLNTSPVTTNGGIVAPTALASASATDLAAVFKSPPFSAAGAPANLSPTATPSWARVEIAQSGSLVTLTINNTRIMTATNTTPYQAGNLFLGYADAYDSIGCNGGVIYDNVRVLVFPDFTITGVDIVAGNVEITFTADSAGPFTVEAATAVAGPYAPAAATITSAGAGQFLAKVPYHAGTPIRFFRIKR